MVEYESRKIRGWRGRLEDDITARRGLICSAPVTVICDPNLETPRSENLAGCRRWFRLVYGPERKVAVEEFKKLTALRVSIRCSEMTPDQKLEKSNRDRARYDRLTPEQKQQRVERARARRAAWTEEQREHERARLRQWRAKQGDDWRAKQAQMKSIRRLANLDLYRAIDRRSKERAKMRRAAQKTGQIPT